VPPRSIEQKTPASGPHGRVADEAGDIWFTANFAGYIGKLDPKTGVRSSSIACPMALAIRICRCSTRPEIFGSRTWGRT
jgi:streptogramin lyase